MAEDSKVVKGSLNVNQIQHMNHSFLDKTSAYSWGRIPHRRSCSSGNPDFLHLPFPGCWETLESKLTRFVETGPLSTGAPADPEWTPFTSCAGRGGAAFLPQACNQNPFYTPAKLHRVFRSNSARRGGGGGTCIYVRPHED